MLASRDLLLLHLRVFVSIDSDVVVLVTQDLGLAVVIQGGGASHGQDGGEDDDHLHFEWGVVCFFRCY